MCSHEGIRYLHSALSSQYDASAPISVLLADLNDIHEKMPKMKGIRGPAESTDNKGRHVCSARRSDF